MATSEIGTIFAKLPELYEKGKKVKKARTFYFSLGDDEKWTVTLSPEACEVRPGKTENADCFVKATSQMLLDVWNGKYTPSAKDFFSGAIKSNNPLLLRDFIDAFKVS
jgi:putative sterol carrier protein